MELVGFDFAYMFKYSERPGTSAARKLKDDVPESVKSERLSEMISLQNRLSAKSKKNDIGMVFDVLIEGLSKRSAEYLSGRTSQNKVVVFPVVNLNKGEYAKILIEKCTSATLLGKCV
jgi:tRNA-2-methylthio-N6-dimethylallyladenosine synthase